MIEVVKYLTLGEAIKLHVIYMRRVGEERFGVFDRSLIDSALSRPKHAAKYENADTIRQAATLFYGLIKSHPWVGGNKRTATLLMVKFLRRNGVTLKAETSELVDLCLSTESGKFEVNDIATWLEPRAIDSNNNL